MAIVPVSLVSAQAAVPPPPPVAAVAVVVVVVVLVVEAVCGGDGDCNCCDGFCCWNLVVVGVALVVDS